MKTIRTLSIFLVVIIILLAVSQSNGQNQSMLLPVPGTYSTGPTDLDGCKVINFSNSSSPVITDLPRHPFTAFGQTGRPHEEDHLENASISMNEKYLGQHPMFAQQVVHDKDGNLLFFIVDNNIYNRYGEAFHLYYPDGIGYLDDELFTYLAVITGIDGANFNRFNTMGRSIDPELIVFPIQNTCYKFGVVYSIYDYNNNSGASQVYYSTIEYIDDQKIIVSPGVCITDNLPGATGCNNFSIRNLAISDYRTEYNDRLLFVHFFNKLRIFNIDANGIISTNTNQIVEIPLSTSTASQNLHPQQSSEMEVIKSGDYYYVALGSCYGGNNVSDALVHVVKISYSDPTSYSSPWDYTCPLNSSVPSIFVEHIKGFEFSPDASKLYITYTGQPNLGYLNISQTGITGYSSLNISNPELYQYSEIELGRDGKLYYLFSTENESMGGVSRLNNPNNPNITTDWEPNILQGQINKVYFSHDYGVDGSKILQFIDQVDGSDYTSYYNTISPECCINHLNYSKWPTLTGGSHTWEPGTNNPFGSVDGIINIENDIEIPDGNSLTITNFTVKFKTGKKLIVKPGAKLVLDNTKLTSVDGCNITVLWQGIEVWGPTSQHQYTINDNCAQGTVILINGGTIENAVCGLVTAAYDAGSGKEVLGMHGGIIQATDAYFKNCKTAVKFLPYENFNPSIASQIKPNKSFFKNCLFETTDAYYALTNEAPQSFLELNGISGLQIRGCDFKNSSSSNYGYKGTGIQSMNTSFYVQPTQLCPYLPCNQFDKNTFEKLHYGIFAKCTNATKSPTINQCEFTNNFRGIRLEGVNGAIITNNLFDIGESEEPYVPGSAHIFDSYGLHLSGSTAYSVYGNEFSSSHSGYFGVIVSNSGITANLIHNNTFDGLQRAVQAEGINGSNPIKGPVTGTNNGLVIKCNDFSDNDKCDIAVTNGQYAGGIINVNQGGCLLPNSAADNTFSGVGSLANIYASSFVTPFNYTYNSSLSNTDPVISAGITKEACTGTPNCTIPNPLDINAAKGIIAELSEKKNLLGDKIDGGTTQDIIDYIAAQPEADVLLIYLDDYSPYLSDEVLIASIKYLDANLSSKDAIAEFVIKNSPLTENVMKVVTHIDFNPELRASILLAQSGIAVRYNYEDSLVSVNREMDYVRNEMLRWYLSDSSEVRIKELGDTIVEMLADNLYIGDDFKLLGAEALLQGGDIAAATQILSTIQSSRAEINNAVDFLSILADTNAVGDSIQLSSIQIQKLWDIRHSDTRISAHAGTLLEFALDTIFAESIQELSIPDSLSIAGYLLSNPNCNMAAQGGDTLVIKTPQGLVLAEISPAVTDSNGHFMFNPFELARLSDTLHFSIATKHNFSVDALGIHTKSEWISQSPMTISIEKLNQMWGVEIDSNQSIFESVRTLAMSDQIYAANSLYNNISGNRDVLLQKIDTTGNQLWQVNNDYSGNDDLIDIVIGDSLKVYMLVASEYGNPRCRLVVYDTGGQLKWVADISDINDPKGIVKDNNGFVYVVGNAESQNNNKGYVSKVSSIGNVVWSSYCDGSVDFSSVAIQSNSDIVVLTSDSTTENSFVNIIDHSTGQVLSTQEIYVSSYYANNLMVETDSTYFISGNNDDMVGGKFDFVNGLQDYIQDTGFINPGCMVIDSEGNQIVVYNTSVGFTVACYDTNYSLIWQKAENGNWFVVADKMVLRLDNDNNIYVVLSVSDFESFEYQSYLFSFDNKGDKIYEHSFEGIGVLDFMVSENKNIYINGIKKAEELILLTEKYAQCYASASMRSLEKQTTSTNVSDAQAKLYPNPNNGNMTLEYSFGEHNRGNFELYDYAGRKIYQQNLNNGSGKVEVAVPGLNNGVYMYKLTSDNNTIKSGRVVVIK